jgi:hypothetical protein
MSPPRKKRGRKKPISPVDSPALKRIIEEVRVGKDEPRGGYNRTYHRHNR